MSDEKRIESLKKLREPFDEHQIGKLPKPTKQQTDEVKKDYRKGVRCELCGGWHHPNVVHLDYVGHAALTDRLLDVDPEWNWEPLSWTDQGTPFIDSSGGMWIKLTICGVSRIGYGDAGVKKGGDATKELIGDALRNAGMRFGMALDLWHKGDLHKLDEEPVEEQEEEKYHHETTPSENAQKWIDWIDTFANSNIDTFLSAWDQYGPAIEQNFKGRDLEVLLRAKKEVETLLIEKSEESK